MRVNKLTKKYICPICGYDKLEENPYYKEVLSSYEICPCCGFEFGVTYDNELDVENGIYSEEAAIIYYRKIWILTGASWFYEQIYKRDTLPNSDSSKEELKVILENIKRDKPEDWSLENQLRNINIDLEEFMKKNPLLKHGYYRDNIYGCGIIYEYRGGVFAKNIKNNKYAEILHFYNIADFMGESKDITKGYLGKNVKVVMDRPLGSKHPNCGLVYPINYGYIPNTVSGDGEEIDAYIVGEVEPVEVYEGYVVAIIHRKNDNEDKLVVSKNFNIYNKEQIRALTEFQEKFFESEIIMYR